MADIPIEIEVLDTQVRKASAKAVRDAALARIPKRIPGIRDTGDLEPALEPPPEEDEELDKGLVPTLYPDNNPAWDKTGRMGVSNAPRGAKAALTAALDKGSATTSGMLDEYILQMRMAGLRHSDIAARIGAPYDEQYVIGVLSRLTKSMEKTTASEMRMLQVARLEAIINMCWNLASAGSEAHIELLIKTLERLGKVFDLESERTVIEVQYVTEQQTELIFRSVGIAVEAVAAMYDRKFAEAGYEPIAREVVEGTVAQALAEASSTITKAHETPLVLERTKGGGMQIKQEKPVKNQAVMR